MADTIAYLKNETELYTNPPKDIIYKDVEYWKLKKEVTWPTDELELIDVLDVNRYDKDQLQLRIINFLTLHDQELFK